MNIFEMAQIPLNKAIEAMKLDAGAPEPPHQKEHEQDSRGRRQ